MDFVLNHLNDLFTLINTIALAIVAFMKKLK